MVFCVVLSLLGFLGFFSLSLASFSVPDPLNDTAPWPATVKSCPAGYSATVPLRHECGVLEGPVTLLLSVASSFKGPTPSSARTHGCTIRYPVAPMVSQSVRDTRSVSLALPNPAAQGSQRGVMPVSYCKSPSLRSTPHTAPRSESE